MGTYGPAASNHSSFGTSYATASCIEQAIAVTVENDNAHTCSLHGHQGLLHPGRWRFRYKDVLLS